MPKIISDDDYESIRLDLQYEADEMYDMDTDDFWEQYYNPDDEQEYLDNGYVGVDNDDDGTKFVDWYIDYFVQSQLSKFKNVSQD